MLMLSGKRWIHLSFILHAIAAIELHDSKNVHVSVVGLGCLALLPKELSEQMEGYITMVTGDSDVIPRMSDATVGNLAFNLSKYDYTTKAR